MAWWDDLASGSFDFSSPDIDWSALAQKAGGYVGDTLLRPEVLLPIAAAGGGMYLQNKALKDAQKKQEAIINQSIADQGVFQQPVNQAVTQMAAERAVPKVQEETATIAQKLAGGLDDYTAQARAAIPQDARSGRLSSDYTSGLASMNAAEAARRAKINQAWAGMVAPQQQQFNQGLRDVGYNTTIGNATSDAGALQRTASLNLQKAQPSGGQLTLGNALQTGGAALAANALLRPTVKALPKLLSSTISAPADYGEFF